MSEDRLGFILSGGPNLKESPHWRRVDSRLALDGLPGITAKMVIGGNDLYVKTMWFERRIVRIDITLSSGNGGMSPDSNDENLDQTRFDLSKAWLEDSCRLASKLLQTGNVSIGTIIESWVGVEGYPQGYCPQLNGIQKGPLHAAAMLIKNRLCDWYDFMDRIATAEEGEDLSKKALSGNIRVSG